MTDENPFVDNALEATIRIGVLLLIAAWCFSIIKPFIIPIAWAIIIAVGTYPAYGKLTARLGGRRAPAAALIAMLGIIILILPAAMLSGTVIEGAHGMAENLKDGALAVPPPPDGIKSWPVVGEQLHAFWSQASANLASTLSKFAPQLKAFGSWLLSAAAGAGFVILQLFVAVIIAGFLLAHSETGGRATRAIARRLAGTQGESFARLAEATVRSVARGILGVALIQSLLIALGFLVMGVPGAGLWALLCLILSVIQIGPMLVVIPVVFYVFSTADTLPAILFLIWSIFTGAIDNILKPILLGRGVDVPMAVVFIGAIGGFISSGIIGLFVGAVVLVLGYKLILAWLGEDANSPPPVAPEQPTSPSNGD
ncbi:AI-2E family transporter [Thiorhodococcus minor]|uniref:AI-2E family transporter n=1 Tax=Thiorhodococcus minor TaxID=57489 RepID=A0A6M0JUG1_9GAMM|nr:AI-2E family transporter [Thiorhodococcus minor]NEV61210.1 AI-2E family transporter [Thiorhodococcus minor]